MQNKYSRQLEFCRKYKQATAYIDLNKKNLRTDHEIVTLGRNFYEDVK